VVILSVFQSRPGSKITSRDDGLSIVHIRLNSWWRFDHGLACASGASCPVLAGSRCLARTRTTRPGCCAATGPFLAAGGGEYRRADTHCGAGHLRNADNCARSAGKVTEFRRGPLSFPRPGDDTFALRISADSEGLSIGIDIIVIRRSGVMLLVMNAGVGSPDGATTETVARKALEKVDEALA
jgi:hypothetical protein